MKSSPPHYIERYANRLAIEGLQVFSLGNSNPPFTIATFIKGKKVMRRRMIEHRDDDECWQLGRSGLRPIDAIPQSEVYDC